MRIVEIRERTLPISRYADPAVPSGGLTTSAVAVVTDVQRGGDPVIGYGFASVGRYAQGELMRERFAPRRLAAADTELADAAGTNLDPFRAWQVMMAGEKPGGHGERCVAVGTLDMALWDARISATRSISTLSAPSLHATPVRSRWERRCSRRRRPGSSTGMPACGAIATSCCSIRSTAMGYLDTWTSWRR
jgi:hypothetical protein